MTQPFDDITAPPATEFRDRRSPDRSASPPGVERRQFSNSHDGLSPAARELAIAIDDYKINKRRRFITYEEILSVIQEIGYVKQSQPAQSPQNPQA